MLSTKSGLGKWAAQARVPARPPIVPIRGGARACNAPRKGGDSPVLRDTPESAVQEVYLQAPGCTQPTHQRPAEWLPSSIKILAKACVLACGLVVCHQAVAPAVKAAVEATTGGNALSGLVSFILHLDKHLSAMIEQHGQATYGILWAIVFAETGLVLTPFLPGDSLLFAAGAFAGMGKLDVSILMVVFLTSAILGDAVNYAVGNKLGGWAVNSKLVKQEYIAKTEKFYAKYGGKTVVLARFVPIIRTFAPFVAGVGSMPYSQFATYNVLGAIVWSVLFVGAGFFFGNLPFVQKNFTLVVLGIVAVSVVPVIIELINARREEQQEREAGGSGGAAKA